MDFGLRDWLLILGPVFIAGILIHGYWRMRSNRGHLKMSLDKKFLSKTGDGEDDGFFTMTGELPNGGARVIPEQTRLDLDKDVPVLMDPVDSTEQKPLVSQEPSANQEPSASQKPSANQKPSAEQDSSDDATEEPLFEEPLFEEQPLTATRDAVVVMDDEIEASPISAPLSESETTPERRDNTVRPTIERPEKFVVIHIIANNEPFSGQRLLECLSEQRMSHGEMSIFHRLNDQGLSVFSLANAVEPGIFDLDTMASLATPGVSMFLRVHELSEPVVAFDEMIAVAGYLSEELNGLVKDETRSVMTAQTFEYSRSEIVKYQHQYQNKNQ